MDFVWRDCGYASNNSKHGRDTNYDVYLSLARSSRKPKADEWAIYDITLTFRRDAFKIIKRWDYTAAQISQILPNSQLLGIRFYTAKEAARSKKTRNLSFNPDGKSCRIQFPIRTKNEYSIINDRWDKKSYDLYSDVNSECYYIKAVL